MFASCCAAAIFLVMFFLVVTEKVPRHVATMGCALATLVIVFLFGMQSTSAVWEALSLYSFGHLDFWYQVGAPTTSTGINWETIVFIAGMMIMVEGMAESGFFRWLCMTLAKLVHYRAAPLFVTFMVLSGVLSMFIDSITVILFLAAVTVELAQLLKVDPVPFILTEIFCANLGGSATMCGDPPNIIIGTSLGYSFGDFIANTGVMAALSALLAVPFFCLFFRKDLRAMQRAQPPANCPDPGSTIVSRPAFVMSCAIFAVTVVLLITHAQTRLTVSFIGMFAALSTLVTAGKKAKSILARLDYKTLLFFVGLFVVVSGLEQTGILEWLASLIGRVSGGSPYLIIMILIWGSAIASAFIDNIPFAATMIPVIKSLAAAQGMDLHTLAWALSMGTDIGGSATPIGASANVVGTSIAAKSGHPISWRRYCRSMAPATILVILVCTLYIFARYL